MADDSLRLVELLEVFFLLFRQYLPLCLNRLIDTLDTAEPNNRTSHPLVDPRQRYMAHLPPALFSNFLHAPNDLLVDRGRAGCRRVGFLFAGGASRVAKGSGRTGEVASAKGSPLVGTGQLMPTDHGTGVRKNWMERDVAARTGIKPTPVSLQNLFISLSSSRYSRL